MNATVKDFAALILRMWVGLNVAFSHGYPKLADTQTYLASESLQNVPAPVLAGWFVMLVELLGGLALALGLFTRLSGSLVVIVMLGVALIGAGSAPWAARELPLTYAVVILLFLVIGGGKLSFDAHLDRRRRTRSPW